ncbi:MAG: membrane integrity-associated transporter subunit PqiC [Deltaproteobacteria bacterium]|nr:membrane integrity-associated transporter subunit PqiC [Deltaproteobacteria bacterium]
MKRRCHAALALAVALTTPACTSLLPKTPPSHFYVLSASDERASATQAIAIGVGPVQLPPYTDRPQIVVRTGPNAISFEETRRWATPLQQAVTSVLMIDLGRRLGTDRVTAFPFALGLPRDYDVSVDFFHFEPDSSGAVLVEALWRIQDSATGGERVVRRSRLDRSTPPGDFAAASAALSDALGELAAEIAVAVEQVRIAR